MPSYTVPDINLFDLPDITRVLTSFMSVCTLYRCLFVSHSWHQKYFLELWRSFDLSQKFAQSPSALETLHGHVPYVEY